MISIKANNYIRYYHNDNHNGIYDCVTAILRGRMQLHISEEEIHNAASNVASWSELSAYDESYSNLEQYGIEIKCFDPELEISNVNTYKTIENDSDVLKVGASIIDDLGYRGTILRINKTKEVLEKYPDGLYYVSHDLDRFGHKVFTDGWYVPRKLTPASSITERQSVKESLQAKREHSKVPNINVFQVAKNAVEKIKSQFQK